MPLPKSITSLLTAIVVAVPAAITTLALNKPKPPKEIDAVIQLDENREEIPEKEINPVIPSPPSSPPTPPKSPGSSGSGGGGGGSMEVESDAPSPDSSTDSESSSTATEPEAAKDETVVETQEKEEKEDKKEEPQTEDEDNDEEEPPTEPEQQDKDVSVKELEESIVSIIEILIKEGQGFDIKNSRLYKQYTISSKLVELKKTIESWKVKKDEEAKDAQSKGAVSGTSVPTEQQGK